MNLDELDKRLRGELTLNRDEVRLVLAVLRAAKVLSVAICTGFGPMGKSDDEIRMDLRAAIKEAKP